MAAHHQPESGGKGFIDQPIVIETSAKKRIKLRLVANPL
jgi:hypothetical protein